MLRRQWELEKLETERKEKEEQRKRLDLGSVYAYACMHAYICGKLNENECMW